MRGLERPVWLGAQIFRRNIPTSSSGDDSHETSQIEERVAPGRPDKRGGQPVSRQHRNSARILIEFQNPPGHVSERKRRKERESFGLVGELVQCQWCLGATRIGAPNCARPRSCVRFAGLDVLALALAVSFSSGAWPPPTPAHADWSVRRLPRWAPNKLAERANGPLLRVSSGEAGRGVERRVREEKTQHQLGAANWAWPVE